LNHGKRTMSTEGAEEKEVEKKEVPGESTGFA
jgi:hypothetical protein